MNEGHIAHLYEEVYSRPDDNELRSVLADALLAIDDPRGELIRCQLEPTRDHERRAMRLVQQFGLAWMGALRGRVIPLAYERGFVATCQALEGAHELAGAREWSTVREIEMVTARGAFLFDPVMRSLRVVSNVPRRDVDHLTTHPLLQTIVTRANEHITRRADGSWHFPDDFGDRDDSD